MTALLSRCACVSGTVPTQQAEVSAVNAERERIRNNASQAEQRIAALENELETAKQVREDSGGQRRCFAVTCSVQNCRYP